MVLRSIDNSDSGGGLVVAVAGWGPTDHSMISDDCARKGFSLLECTDQDLPAENPGSIALVAIGPAVDTERGLSACREIRLKSPAARICWFPRDFEPKTAIMATQAGADYLPCPFAAAHVRSLLRVIHEVRCAEQPTAAARRDADAAPVLADLKIDRQLYKVTIGSRRVPLTRTEFDLLAYLLDNRERVVSPRELIHTVLRTNVSPRTVDEHVLNLRRKLNPRDSSDTFVRRIRARGFWIDESWAGVR